MPLKPKCLLATLEFNLLSFGFKSFKLTFPPRTIFFPFFIIIIPTDENFVWREISQTKIKCEREKKKIFRGSENLEIPRVGISNVIQFGGYLSY